MNYIEFLFQKYFFFLNYAYQPPNNKSITQKIKKK
jgi:hypothetical protein